MALPSAKLRSKRSASPCLLALRPWTMKPSFYVRKSVGCPSWLEESMPHTVFTTHLHTLNVLSDHHTLMARCLLPEVASSPENGRALIRFNPDSMWRYVCSLSFRSFPQLRRTQHKGSIEPEIRHSSRPFTYHAHPSLVTPTTSNVLILRAMDLGGFGSSSGPSGDPSNLSPSRLSESQPRHSSVFVPSPSLQCPRASPLLRFPVARHPPGT